MAYVGNTPFGPSCPSPTRVFAQVNTGFRSVRRSVGLAHDPTSQETPARPSKVPPVARGAGSSTTRSAARRRLGGLNPGSGLLLPLPGFCLDIALVEIHHATRSSETLLNSTKADQSHFQGWVLLTPPREGLRLSLIHISEPTRLGMISYAVFCLKK